MSTTYLGYSFAVVNNCDTYTDWTAGDADMTVSQETNIKRLGTGSVKCAVADGASADDVMMYCNTASNSDYSAKSYFVAWVYSSVALNAGDVQFAYAQDDALATPVEWIDLPAMTAAKWYRVVFVPTAAAASRNSVDSIGFRMHIDKGAFNFYVDDVEVCIGNAYSTLGTRGLTHAEEISKWPGQQWECVDGSSIELISTNRRIVTINFGVLTSTTDQTFLNSFFDATDKVIFFENDECQVVNESANAFGNEWLDGVEYARNYTMRFKEKTAWTTPPPSWS